MNTMDASRSSWRRWYATYLESNVVRLFSNPVAESTAARAAIAFGDLHGIDCSMLRSIDSLKRGK